MQMVNAMEPYGMELNKFIYLNIPGCSGHGNILLTEVVKNFLLSSEDGHLRIKWVMVVKHTR